MGASFVQLPQECELFMMCNCDSSVLVQNKVLNFPVEDRMDAILKQIGIRKNL